MIEYKRGRCDETSTSSRKTRESRCGRFKIEECRNHYEKRINYYALENCDGRWVLIVEGKRNNFYRTRARAEKAIEDRLRLTNKWLAALAKGKA